MLITFRNALRSLIGDARKEIIYSTVCPDAVHLIKPFIRLLPEDDYISILILNGTSPRQKEEIESTIKGRNTIHAVSVHERPWKIRHGTIITELCYCTGRDFYMIDPDCFVFNKNIFSQMNLDKEEIVSCAFHFKYTAEARFPRTYFMKLNPLLVKNIMEKYAITCEDCTTVPPSVIKRLPGQKIVAPYGGEGTFFDTLQLVLTQPLNTYTIKYLAPQAGDVEHIGATTWGISWLETHKNIEEYLKENKNDIFILKECLRGVYFNLLYLEKDDHANTVFHTMLTDLYGSSEQFLKTHNVAAYIDTTAINNIINKLL